VFGKKGLFRQGMMDLLVWLNTPADGSSNTTTPGKVRDGDKEQHHRLAKLTKKYHTGGPNVQVVNLLFFSPSAACHLLFSNVR
jgi:phosphatidylinositol 3-kinase